MAMIICIGDSITAAQHIDGGLSWPSHLERMTGDEVIAAGVPGDTTRLGLERFPIAVQMREPDIVVIQFGHNDANRWQTDRGLPRVSKWAYSANLGEMVDRARTFGAIAVLCTLTPTHRPDPHPADCAVYDQVLRDVAARRAVPLADVSHIDETVDGLHLDASGHELYAAVVAKVIAGFRL